MVDYQSTESNFVVNVVIDGVDFGEWDKVGGGGTTEAIGKGVLGSNPGMQAMLPARKDYEDLTLTRNFVARTCQELERYLLTADGISVTATRRPVDIKRLPVGSPLTHTGGLVSKVEPVIYDNASSTGATLVVTVTGGRWQ